MHTTSHRHDIIKDLLNSDLLLVRLLQANSPEVAWGASSMPIAVFQNLSWHRTVIENPETGYWLKLMMTNSYKRLESYYDRQNYLIGLGLSECLAFFMDCSLCYSKHIKNLSKLPRLIHRNSSICAYIDPIYFHVLIQ